MLTNEHSEVVEMSRLRFDGGTQCRETIDSDYCVELRQLFNEDNPVWPRELPPLKACRDEAGELWVWDGFHSATAAKAAGCVYVPVQIRDGSLEDAQWLACSANKSHGMRRKQGDVARAVRMAWTLRPNATTREIAAHVGCTQQWASECNPCRPSESKKRQGLSELTTSCQKRQDSSQIEYPAHWNDAVDEGDDCEPDAIIETESESGEVGNHTEPSNPVPSAEGARSASPPDSPEEFDMEAIRGQFDRIDSAIKSLAGLLNVAASMPGGELLRDNYLNVRGETRNGQSVYRHRSLELDNLRAAVERFRPHRDICPICRGKKNPQCRVCNGLPFVTKSAWDNCSEKQRAGL